MRAQSAIQYAQILSVCVLGKAASHYSLAEFVCSLRLPARDESLDALQHLSVDGMMRPWLPNYANSGKLLTQTGKGMGGLAHFVISITPGGAANSSAWHCLLSVRAGRMMPATSEPTTSASSSGVHSGASASAGISVVQPDMRKGSLALLQSTSDESVLKLVWRERKSGNHGAPQSIWEAREHSTASFADREDEDQESPWNLDTAEICFTTCPTRTSFR